jgi:DNA (cytosine-5)-methyltransferase 1
MTHGSLFSGIGGFDLAAHWMGWDNTFHCEWNPFGQKVLKHHFPNSISYNDITKTDFTIHEGRIDILTGGFPCQPYSTAGLRKGKADERHLFPEMLRAIKEIKPRWVIGENVRGLVSWNGGMVFNEVCDDLEREGYEVQPFLIPAAGVNAPHQRQRIWFIAYSNNKGRSGEPREVQKENGKISKRNNNAEPCNSSDGNVANTESIRSSFRKLGESEKRQQIQTRSNIDGFNDLENATNSEDIRSKYALENGELEGGRSWQSYKRNFWDSFPSKSPVCGGDDGLPRELDNITFPKWRNESIKGFGNAIVPQVAHEIFKTIEKFENSL